MHHALRKLEAAAGTTRTMLLFFPKIQASAWIDGVNFSDLSWDIEDLAREAGLTESEAGCLVGCHVVSLDEEEKIFNRCFVHDEFNQTLYTELSEALTKHSEEKVAAALDCGVPLGDMGDRFLYEGDFKSFCKERFWELYENEIPKAIHTYIDFDAVAEDWQHSYLYSNNFVFTEE